MCQTAWMRAIVGKLRKTPEYLENIKLKIQKQLIKLDTQALARAMEHFKYSV